MNLQTIAEIAKQREEISNQLQSIYLAIIEQEVAHAATLSKKELAQYQRIYCEEFKSERKYGWKGLDENRVGWSHKFYLNTDEDALTITAEGIECYGYTDTQSGRFDDPIFLPAYLIDAHGTDQWEAALARYTEERIAAIEAIIRKENRAAKAEARASAQRKEERDRAEFERLQAKYGAQ